ncbi:uncharacterized protein LOC109604303 isoform X23 [Aethina tumida]|uniref:uncharacterized protein LOC109604303 isoform X23 n=1 Tax=Aethina tumida TaxID=116153 RepID=UPI0021497D9B|nr:uncharacterized protein LOC109604303 isoform X23 [Aethina tumida]
MDAMYNDLIESSDDDFGLLDSLFDEEGDEFNTFVADLEMLDCSPVHEDDELDSSFDRIFDDDYDLLRPLSDVGVKMESSDSDELRSNPDVDVDLLRPLADVGVKMESSDTDELISNPDVDVDLPRPLADVGVKMESSDSDELRSNPDVDVDLLRPLTDVGVKMESSDTDELISNPDVDVDLPRPLADVGVKMESSDSDELRSNPDVDVDLLRPLADVGVKMESSDTDELLSNPDVDFDLPRPLAERPTNALVAAPFALPREPNGARTMDDDMNSFHNYIEFNSSSDDDDDDDDVLSLLQGMLELHQRIIRFLFPRRRRERQNFFIHDNPLENYGGATGEGLPIVIRCSQELIRMCRRELVVRYGNRELVRRGIRFNRDLIRRGRRSFELVRTGRRGSQELENRGRRSQGIVRREWRGLIRRGGPGLARRGRRLWQRHRRAGTFIKALRDFNRQLIRKWREIGRKVTNRRNI